MPRNLLELSKQKLKRHDSEMKTILEMLGKDRKDPMRVSVDLLLFQLVDKPADIELLIYSINLHALRYSDT